MTRSFDLRPQFNSDISLHEKPQKEQCSPSWRVHVIQLLFFFNFGGSIKLRETWHIINLNAKFTIISAVKLGICQRLGSPGSRNTDEHAGYLLRSVFGIDMGGREGKEEGLGKGRTWSVIVSTVIIMKCFETEMVL